MGRKNAQGKRIVVDLGVICRRRGKEERQVQKACGLKTNVTEYLMHENEHRVPGQTRPRTHRGDSTGPILLEGLFPLVFLDGNVIILIPCT